MLAEIAHLLEQIPASFWGVVVGSFFSITGVALTNRASDKRLRAQFEHERELKTKDREMALRKEVFLGAAEAVAAGMNAIGRFANFDIPNDQVTNGYIDKAPAISKVHVIACTDTVQALAQFTSRLTSLYVALFARRYELLNEKNVIGILDNQVAQFEKERDRVIEMIKQHNIEGIINPRRWDVLQHNFEFEQKRIIEALERRAQLMAALAPKQLQFMRDCIAYTAELGEMLFPLLASVRAELELPLDEYAYRTVMEEGYAMQQEAIDAFIQKFMPKTAQSIDTVDSVAV